MKIFKIIIYVFLIIVGVIYLFLPVDILLKNKKINSPEEYEKKVKQIKIYGLIMIVLGVLLLIFK